MAWYFNSSSRILFLLFLIQAITYIIYTEYYKHFTKSQLTTTRAVNQSDIHILCFGDSLTAGHTGYFNRKVIYHPYSQNLGKLLNSNKRLRNNSGNRFVVHSKGVNGELAQFSMERRLPRLLKDSNYQWVIILGGTNDLRVIKETSLESQHIDRRYLAIFSALRNLHHAVHKHGGRTVAVTIPGRLCERTSTKCLMIKHMRLRINALLRDFAWKSKGNVVLTDLAKHMPVATSSHKYWGDEVHFNAWGYDKMGTLIYNTLLENYSRVI